MKFTACSFRQELFQSVKGLKGCRDRSILIGYVLNLTKKTWVALVLITGKVKYISGI